jgi:two-component system, NtrC family, response regulator AtoC
MKSLYKIFVVEDDLWYSKYLNHQLSLNPEYEVKVFNDAKSFLEAMHELPDIITLDYNLPDMNGSEILKKIKSISPETNVIIISGQEDIQTAINLLKDGAYDYITKDDNTKNRIFNIISHIRDNIGLQKELNLLREEVIEKYDYEKSIIGNSPAIKQIYSLIKKACLTNINVSITGETGTGKELIAKTIHFQSKRNKMPFVAVNVAAIPRELIESELFGHEKGAFTGANARRIGKFEEANKGTLFLDEIGEFDLNLQSKLLRVLQEREITRIGGNGVVPVDVRIITATHKNLAEEVKAGRFREDLYYRLIGMPIFLPPLRERDNDALLISKHFIQTFCKENGIKQKQLSPEAKERLITYPFPGNIRELKAIIDLAIVMSEGEMIELEDLTFMRSAEPDDFLMEELSLDEYNQKIIQFFLNKYNGNVLTVAKKLDIGKSTIYRFIQEGKIKLPK